jgi:hypothetical protein
MNRIKLIMQGKKIGSKVIAPQLTTFICIMLFTSFSHQASAQMTPPGYERQLKKQEQNDPLTALDRDSILVRDTSVIFYPESYEEEVKIIQRKLSLREYARQELGIDDPDKLLDGKVMTIVDPETYKELKVRYNQVTHKIERIQ